VTDLSAVVEDIKSGVDELAPRLIGLSHRIHANPELGLQERLACGWCTELLRSEGFTVETPVAGLETAFRATRGSGRPSVSFLAEYDALPGVGHACGHNVIAASALGAGIALARALERAGRSVTVIVDGTPAEETMGGKIPFVDQGLFREVDLVLSMHPDTTNAAGGTCLAVQALRFSFAGRAAHAAAEPERGINALDAVIQTFNNINSLRQHVKSDVRIHGIITDGGKAPNVVPDSARAEFFVRAASLAYHTEVVEKVKNCARAAALATGASLETEADPVFEPVRENATLVRLALETMAELGMEGQNLTGRCIPGSTDFGNVSQVVPALAPAFKIAPPGVVCHHQDFAAAAASGEADSAILAAAKVLATVAARVVLDRDTLQAVAADHGRT
jgi:amidohydrolase